MVKPDLSNVPDKELVDKESSQLPNKIELTEEEYEEIEDEILLEIALNRLENSDPSTWSSWEDVLLKFGYTEDDFGEWTEEDEADLE